MSGARDWVVTYKSRPRSAAVVFALLEGVPVDVDLEGVMEALEAWQRWPQWQARMRPGAVLSVRRRTRGDDERLEGARVQTVPWAQLAPAVKRIQVEAPGAVYAAAHRAARASGMSLARWVLTAIAAAAAVELDELEAGEPASLFEDVPLPGLPV